MPLCLRGLRINASIDVTGDMLVKTLATVRAACNSCTPLSPSPALKRFQLIASCLPAPAPPTRPHARMRPPARARARTHAHTQVHIFTRACARLALTRPRTHARTPTHVHLRTPTPAPTPTPTRTHARVSRRARAQRTRTGHTPCARLPFLPSCKRTLPSTRSWIWGKQLVSFVRFPDLTKLMILVTFC